MSTAKSYEKVNINKVVGRNILYARKARSISRDDLAALLDVSTSHMGLIERGERGAHALNLAKMSKIFNMPVGDFFANIDNNQSPTFFEPDSKLQANRETIYTLTGGLGEAEMEYVASMIKGLLEMMRNI